MSAEPTRETTFALSVVIPSFNSARWLPSTLGALAAAVRAADIAVEVVVVDDGSTDDTEAVLRSLQAGFPGEVVVVRQENGGRFLARWAGIQRARSATVFLLDSRVLVAPDALRNYVSASRVDPAQRAWNGYVVTDPASPLVGLFWEVPTHVFWGRFLRSPRPFDLTRDTFDSAPKGTGMFIARKSDLEAAFLASWPEATPASSRTTQRSCATSPTPRPSASNRGSRLRTVRERPCAVSSATPSTGGRSSSTATPVPASCVRSCCSCSRRCLLSRSPR